MLNLITHSLRCDILKKNSCPNVKICVFQNISLRIYKKTWPKIYLPNCHFHLPQAVGQWNMSSLILEIMVIIGWDDELMILQQKKQQKKNMLIYSPMEHIRCKGFLGQSVVLNDSKCFLLYLLKGQQLSWSAVLIKQTHCPVYHPLTFFKSLSLLFGDLPVSFSSRPLFSMCKDKIPAMDTALR